MSASVPAASRLNNNSIQQLFTRYADPIDGVILADGVGRFCDDLGVRACLLLVAVGCFTSNAEAMRNCARVPEAAPPWLVIIIIIKAMVLT